MYAVLWVVVRVVLCRSSMHAQMNFVFSLRIYFSFEIVEDARLTCSHTLSGLASHIC